MKTENSDYADKKRSQEIDEEIKSLQSQLQENTSKPKWHHFLGVTFIIALLVLGLTDVFGDFQAWIKTTFLGQAREIKLLSKNSNNLLVRIRDKGRFEIKLINVNTNAIKDISSGDKNARLAAISPDQKRIVYVSTNDKGSALYLTADSLRMTKIFDGNILKNAGASKFGQKSIKVCDWSSLEWNGNSEQIIFWGCGETKDSALFIVNIRQGDIPKLLDKTYSKNSLPRTAAFIDEEKIVFSTIEDTHISLQIIDTSSQALPQRVYGPIQ